MKCQSVLGILCSTLLAAPLFAGAAPVDFDGAGKQAGQPVFSALQTFRCQERPAAVAAASADESGWTVTKRTRRVLSQEEVEDTLNLYLRGSAASQPRPLQQWLAAKKDDKVALLSSSGNGGTRTYYEEEETEQQQQFGERIRIIICKLRWKVTCKLVCLGAPPEYDCYEECQKTLVSKQCRTQEK